MGTDSILRNAYRAADSAHGDLGLCFDEFAERVRTLTRARLGRTSGPEPVAAGALERALAKLHLEDLHLAIACDQGGARALECFMRSDGSRMSAFLRRASLAPDEVRQLLQDLPGDLVAAPPDGRARTRFGTYEGTSSLFSWLAVILLRRRADSARDRVAGRAPEPSHSTVDARASTDCGPPEELIGRETGERAAAALRASFDELTANERLCLLYRFHDQLAQREIARLLAVGEPRVSKLIGQALGKLRPALLRAAGEEGPLDEHLRRRVRDAVAICLESLRGRVERPARRGGSER